MKPPVTQPVPLAAGRVHTLHPGDVVCAERGDRLETLLGSCVALLLTDPRRTVAAMCHVVHARPAPAADRRNSAHGDAAVMRLAGLLRARGIEPRLCEAWVFGGGNMFPRFAGATPAEGHVGAANAAWATACLQELGLRVLGSELGGNVYRKVVWTIGAGEPVVTAVPT